MFRICGATGVAPQVQGPRRRDGLRREIADLPWIWTGRLAIWTSKGPARV